MTRGLFITGTDTDVGKTVVAALVTQGWNGAHYWKPVQCGLDGGGDRERVARWTGLDPERLLPDAYRLRMPASPHVAAAAEGVEIRRARLRAPGVAGPLVVEGAGGVLVPLNRRHTMLDLMSWLGLPVMLVARTQLGTINHTLLSLEALRRRGLRVHTLVLNGDPVATTAATLRERGRVPQVVELGRLRRLDAAGLKAGFARAFAEWRPPGGRRG